MNDTVIEENHAIANARGWLENIQEMVTKLNAYSLDDDSADYEGMREAIQESVLSVMVRDGWHSPGAAIDSDNSAEEYEILLSTGGPALRIIGKLSCGEPAGYPSLQWQDWGTPWTFYVINVAEGEALKTFAQQFYFGD